MKGLLRARCALLFVCLWLAPLFLPGRAVAQSAARVTLSGDVLDPTGAAIPGATVTLHRAGGDQTTTSDGVGHFMFSVPAGRYDLVISEAGFRTYTRFGMMVGSRLPPLKATLEIATSTQARTHFRTMPPPIRAPWSSRATSLIRSPTIQRRCSRNW